MIKRFSQFIGWYGVAAIIAAYILISFEIASAKSLIFQLLNFTGALGIIIETYYKRDYQPLVINIFWLLFALVALMRILIA